MPAPKIYRQSTLGAALTLTLDEFMSDGRIPSHLAAKVIESFDTRIAKLLSHRAASKVTFKGDKLIAYQYTDNMWTFIVGGMEMRDMRRTIDMDILDKVKIIACDGTMNEADIEIKQDVKPPKDLKPSKNTKESKKSAKTPN